jgi:hypothetical protein
MASVRSVSLHVLRLMKEYHGRRSGVDVFWVACIRGCIYPDGQGRIDMVSMKNCMAARFSRPMSVKCYTLHSSAILSSLLRPCAFQSSMSWVALLGYPLSRSRLCPHPMHLVEIETISSSPFQLQPSGQTTRLHLSPRRFFYHHRSTSEETPSAGSRTRHGFHAA